jgi:hypothetical protein
MALTTQDQAAFRGFDKLPDAANVRLGVVAALDSISPCTAWRRVQKGLLPKTFKVGNSVLVNVGQYRAMRAAQIGGAK